MKKTNRGYSLVALIIAIIVILIIASTAVSTLNVSMEEKRMNEFIYDINSIEEGVRQYYSTTGTIPVTGDVANVSIVADQRDINDGEVYHNLDLTKLSLNNIHEPNKTYVVNDESLRVYLPSGIEYNGLIYYTVTDDLMQKDTKYQTQNLDVVCTVNPSVWSERVSIRVTIPHTYENFDGWTFKYNIGPKDLEFFQGDGGTEFEYGKAITVNTNGVYSIYINNGDDKEIVKNVVVNNVDDIYPKYKLDGTQLTIMDDETGIKEVRYKTYETYTNNRLEFENASRTREPLDYYLLGGKGKTVESIKTDMATYRTKLAEINSRISQLDSNFNALGEEEQANEQAAYNESRSDLLEQKDRLDASYAYILDTTTRYVLYVEDYAGNATAIVEDCLTCEYVCNMFNIKLTNP